MTKFKYKVGDILCGVNPPGDFDIVIIQEIEFDLVWANYIVLYNNKLVRAGPGLIEKTWYYKEDFIKEFDNYHEMTLEEYRKAIKLVFS